ncbi:MAG: hypothetical protein IPP40_13295 [bacterium]|nr:hypothetical protein [bacterium]
MTYNLSLEGSNYDTELYIRTTDACPGTSEVACNDDWFGLQSFLSVTLNAGQTYFIIVDGYFDYFGDYVLNISDNCNIDCQLGDAAECDEAFVDLVGCNGGCNSATPLWQTIYPCQTMCGRGWAAAGGRDTDWYSLTLTEACSLSVTLNAEFVAQIAFIEGASCPFGAVDFYQSWAYPCSTVTFLTQCLQPGTYTFFVSPLSFGGTLALRDYRARIDLVPCSGCRVDGFLQAPGSVTGNTCGEGNDNSLRPSVDYTYCVNIPYESDWTISLCNDDSTWDSYIYLSTQCNGGVIAFDDDRCGTTQLSKIDCIRLTPGNYYLDIEGYFNHCGAYNLRVVECIGRCCYGEPTAPSCFETTISVCDSIGGFFHEGEECSVPCPVHHGCQDASLYGQSPILPGEPGVAYSAHIGHGEEPFDNFAVSGPVGTVRFWGLPLFCDSTITFQISLTSETDTCIYTVSTVGVVMPEDFFGWQLLQYDVQLSPPCGILSGNIAIGMVGNGSCQWYWESSPYGDDIHPYGIPHELSFCLGTSCEPVDSLTINLIADNNYLLSWWQPQAAQVDLYTSIDPNAVYPVGFNYYGSVVTPAGHIAASYATADPFNYAVLILNCAVVPPRSFESESSIQKTD